MSPPGPSHRSRASLGESSTPSSTMHRSSAHTDAPAQEVLSLHMSLDGRVPTASSKARQLPISPAQAPPSRQSSIRKSQSLQKPPQELPAYMPDPYASSMPNGAFLARAAADSHAKSSANSMKPMHKSSSFNNSRRLSLQEASWGQPKTLRNVPSNSSLNSQGDASSLKPKLSQMMNCSDVFIHFRQPPTRHPQRGTTQSVSGRHAAR